MYAINYTQLTKSFKFEITFSDKTYKTTSQYFNFYLTYV